MKRLKYLFLAVCFLSACAEKGPAEKAGEKIDKSVESVKDATKDLSEGEAPSKDGPAEDLGEKLDDVHHRD